MTKKFAIIICILMLSTACEQRQAPQPAKTENSTPSEPQPSHRTPEIKWALANKFKLAEAVKVALIKADPETETKNAQYNESTKERKLIAEQILQVTQELKEKCASEKPNSNNKKIHLNDDRKADSSEPFTVTISELEDYKRSRTNPAYVECANKVKEDQRIRDLQGKIKMIDLLFQEKNQNDQQLRQRADSTLAQLVESYGKAHNYQLIISGGSEIVLFNQSKVVLDVTADLDGYIAQQLSAANKSSSDVPAIPQK